MIGYLAIGLVSLIGVSACTSLLLKYPAISLPRDEAILLVESLAGCFPFQLCFHLLCCVKRSDFVTVILIGPDGKEIGETVAPHITQTEPQLFAISGEEKVPDAVPPVLTATSDYPPNNEAGNVADTGKLQKVAPPSTGKTVSSIEMSSIEMSSKMTTGGTEGEVEKRKKKKKTLKGAADLVKVGTAEEVKKKKKKKRDGAAARQAGT